MKALRIVSKLARVVFWILLAIVLLVSGIVMVLYSQWGQQLVKNALVDKLNQSPGTEFVLNDLRIRFPLDIDISKVMLVQDGDTMLRADTLKANVKLLPLIAGDVDISGARLVNGYYQIGNADSAMCLKISAANIRINPASVNLKNMHISVDDAYMRGATVDMVLKQDTTVSDSTAKQTMQIMLKHLTVDDLTYRMSMLPTIDSLGTNIGHGTLVDGVIDLESQQIRLHTFNADSLTAAYIAPDSATIAANPLLPTPVDAPESAPWTITIDTIHLINSEALYTTQGVKPLPGLDFGYIQAMGMELTITDFYNQATKLSLPLRLHATERSGITLDATGTFAMDSTAMYFREFNIETDNTYLNADGLMGVGDMFTDPSLPLRLKVNGYCGMPDLKLMFPGYAPYLKLLPANCATNLNIDLRGTPSRLDIDDIMIALPACANLHAHGVLRNIFDTPRFGGDLKFDGNIINVKSIVRAFTEPETGLTVPPMSLSGGMHIDHGDMAGNLKANTLGGHLALDGKFNSNTEGFNVDLKTDGFPIDAFMPDLGVGKATMRFTASGRGLDVLDPKTDIDADVDIVSLTYAGYQYHDIQFKAGLHDGLASVDGGVDTEDLSLSLIANGNLTGDTYEWSGHLRGDMIDLMALKLSETPMSITTDIDLSAAFTPATGAIAADMNIPELTYKGSDATEFTLTDIKAKFAANDSLTQLDLHNHDLTATAYVPMGLTGISARFDDVMAVVDTQIAERKINVDTLQRLLPKFNLYVNAGDDNLINDILRPQQMSIGHLSLAASNDSVLALDSKIFEYETGTMRLDTIRLDLAQQQEKMHIVGNVDNTPGNMDNWAHIRVDGLLNTDRISLRLVQQNVSHETGFDLGALAVLADSSVTARLMPLTPMIGYKKWTVNLDNYIYYNFYTHYIDANLKMKGDDSSLQLYTDHEHDLNDEHTDSINNVVLNISDVHLADWISFNPFAPPISGNLSATMNVLWNGGTDINGTGKVTLDDFYYDRKKVASLVMDLDVKTNLAGTVRAKADLIVDGQRTMTVSGNLNDAESDSPFNLDFSVVRFPLATVNPFLPEDVAQMSGVLNGAMRISGDSDHPILNGEIDFENTSIRMAMTNTSYKFSTVKIPVENNLVSFTDFNIMGANENPLYINGTVDISSMVSPKIDLGLKAKNMMVVNTQRASRNALIYGKAYMDLKATVKGNLRFMDVDADVTVLSGTNVTYILTDMATDAISPVDENMVKFVNLNDTTAVAAADSITSESMLMMLDAQLTIQSGTTVTVDLSTVNRDKVQLQPTGYLTYTMAPMSDGRMTGRININSGFVRYTLPVIGSEKMFKFNPDSYVAFNGDLLNPVLNIHATDEVKANVTQQGQNSRLVNFDIGVGITGTLERMDVAFDLSTDDDLTVANELQSMTPEQRANQAMNMLLYNMYTGPGTSATANLSVNPLFSFLESQINNWAAQNIKGVDLSFGIDQYNQTTNGSTSSTMSYSYQVSKTLFNDRFKIVVGGNYTTDSNADENLAENLVNDISFEYYLNKQQTMVLRLFRHVGYESILEGEVIQTGVGFMYRKKLDRLGRMLPKFMRPHYKD